LQRASVANVLPSSPILVTLMTEARLSSETSALTRATLRNIPEDGILRFKSSSQQLEERGFAWDIFRLHAAA
jgi:hypothetical protein